MNSCFVRPTRTVVLAGDGDDRVLVESTCHLHPQMELYGGPGRDVLVLPTDAPPDERLGFVYDEFERIERTLPIVAGGCRK